MVHNNDKKSHDMRLYRKKGGHTMKKILIVDDQYGIRVLLSELFKKEGYQTLQAANGMTAIELVKQECPDLVILDLKMPGMDGLEVFKNLKKFNEEVNVIFMTAYGELQLVQEFMKLGAITHFAKPFDIEEVCRTVKRVVPLDTKEMARTK
jgi:two-component system, response regulator, stage 0 sporulation protein F